MCGQWYTAGIATGGQNKNSLCKEDVHSLAYIQLEIGIAQTDKKERKERKKADEKSNLCGIDCCACRDALRVWEKNGRELHYIRKVFIISGDNPNAPYYETVITDKETGVIYLIVYGYNHLGITPLLNADGTPMLQD